MKIRVSAQVAARLRALHPDHRMEVRQALNFSAKGRGDIKELAGPLSGFYRLRIGRYRVVYRYEGNHIGVLFLEHRSLVYELFRP